MDSIRAHAHVSRQIPVDIDDLLHRCLGRMDIVERILQKFKRTLHKDLEELEHAVLACDIDEIAHIAHRMKGASLSVSAHELREYAQSIEASAKARQFDDIPGYFVKLKEQCARFENLSSITLAS